MALKLAQLVLLVASAPLVRGIVARLKAWLQRRRGASIWRPYADLGKLLRKEDIVPHSASWLFRAAPRLAFAFTMTAAAFVPLFWTGAVLSFAGDFMVLVGGSRGTGGMPGFGGMGASREAMISVLAEFPLLLSLIAIALVAKSTSLAPIVAWTTTQNFFDISAVHVLAVAALIIVAIAETGRIPVDNPTTHLELTMLHEAMVLEYSGPSLAFIEWTQAIKLNLMIALLIGLFFPWGIASGAGVTAIAISIGLYLVKVGLVAMALALVESTVAKLRMYAAPEFLGIASGLAVLAIVFTVISKR